MTALTLDSLYPFGKLKGISLHVAIEHNPTIVRDDADKNLLLLDNEAWEALQSSLLYKNFNQ